MVVIVNGGIIDGTVTVPTEETVTKDVSVRNDGDVVAVYLDSDSVKY